MAYLEIHTVDVGQGDCQLIAVRCSSTRVKQLIMVDGGANFAKEKIYEYWSKNFNRKKIDILIISHWDEDHYRGIYNLTPEQKKEMFENYCPMYSPSVSRPGIPETFILTNIEQNMHIINKQFQDTKGQSHIINLKCHATEDEIHFFRMEQELLQATPTNISSLVFLLEFDDFKYYIGGDIDSSNEDKLVENPYKINCLKLSHHGSASSTSNDFLSQTTPNLAICSNGDRQDYRHPNVETLKRLENHQINTLLTNKKTTESYQSNQRYIAYAGYENCKNGDIKQIIKSNSKIAEVFLESSQLKNLVGVQYSNLGEYNKIKVMLVEFANTLKRTNYNEEVALERSRKISIKLFQTSKTRRLRRCQRGRAARKGSRQPLNPPTSRTELIRRCKSTKRCLSIIYNREPGKFQLTFPDNPLSRAIGTANLSEESSSINAILKEVGFGHLAEHFPSFIDNLFGEIKKSEEDDPDDNNYHIYSLNKKLEINDNLSLDDSEIHFTVYNSEEDNNSLSFFKGTFHSTLKIKEEIFYIHIDFSSNNTWELEIDPENLTLADIVEIIPGFNHSDVEKWTEALHLENLYIERAAIGVNFSSEQKIQYLSLGLGVEIFNDYLLQLTLTYRFGQGMSIYGSLYDPIKTYELLKSCGVSDDHLNIFPDIKIEDLGFSATPKKENYDYEIHASLSELNEKIKLGKIEVSISTIRFVIHKKKEETAIKIELDGKINDTEITIKGEYDKELGFKLEADIEKIELSALLNKINAPINISKFELNDIQIINKPFSIHAIGEFKEKILGQEVDLKISDFNYSKEATSISGDLQLFEIDWKFSISKDLYQLSVENIEFKKVLTTLHVPDEIANHFDITFTKATIIKENDKFKLEISETLNHHFSTLTIKSFDIIIEEKDGKPDIVMDVEIWLPKKVNGENKTLAFEGGFKILEEGISLFAKTKDYKDDPIQKPLNLITEIDSVFGIKDFDLADIYLSLQIGKGEKSGFSIGLMSAFQFKDIVGRIAIQLNTENPEDELLAVNLKSLTLFDIVDSIVECKNSGIESILSEIGIKSIKILDKIEKPVLSDNVLNELKKHSTSTGNYIIKNSDDYHLIPQGTYLIDDTNNFKSYLFSKESVGTYILEEWVDLKACTNVNGITLNSTHFKFGYVFCGKLNFLGIHQIIELNSTPKEGVSLYTELEKAIKIKSILELSRVEDTSKGPILSLSTYPNNRHFYLSAKLKILSIIDFETRILFADNKFAFLLNQHILGFRSCIKASGDFSSLNKTAFALSITFESNGFKDITDKIGNFLRDEAKKISDATEKLRDKIDIAKRHLNEFNRNIEETKAEIKQKKEYIHKLRHKHISKWHPIRKAKNIMKIALAESEKAIMCAHKLEQIALLKTAQETLNIVKKLLKEEGKLTKGILNGVSDILKVIGSNIDWLIKINKLEAKFDLSSTKKELDFDLDIKLCGNNKQKEFSVSIDKKNLKEKLKEEIKKLINLKKTNYLSIKETELSELNKNMSLNDIYGVESISNDDVDLSIHEEHFKAELEKSKKYILILKEDSFFESLHSIIDSFAPVASNKNNNVDKIDTNQIDISGITNCTSFDSTETLLSIQNEFKKTNGMFSRFETEVRPEANQAFKAMHNNLSELNKDSDNTTSELTNLRSYLKVNPELQESINKTVNDHSFCKNKDKSIILSSLISIEDISTNTNKLVQKVISNTSKISQMKPISSDKFKDEKYLYGFNVNEDIEDIEIKPEFRDDTQRESFLHSLIDKYEHIINSDSKMNDYVAITIHESLAQAYNELGNKGKSDEHLEKCKTITKELFGKESDEFSSLQTPL